MSEDRAQPEMRKAEWRRLPKETHRPEIGAIARSERACATRGSAWGLAVDANFAEADQDFAAGLRGAEVHFGSEAGEHHHLIELVMDGGVIGAGENGVGDD